MKVLGIDVGTSTTKVVLADIAADDVRELVVRVGDTPATAVALLALVARLCRDAVGEQGSEIAAVGIASMAETGVPVAADGAALTELLRWDAGHGAADAARMSALAPEIFAATGVRLSAKTPLATWAWLRRERPEVLSRMAHWLGTTDLVAHALTAEADTDHTLAGRTGGYRMPQPDRPMATSFDADLLALVGLDPEHLPRVAAPDGVTAPTSAASARFGIPPGTPVVIAGHDHQVAAWAAGVRQPGDVADSLGTAEAVLTVLPARPDPESVRTQGMSLVLTIGGSHDALVAGNGSAGGMLAHWLSTLPPAARDAALADGAPDRDRDPRPTGAPVAPYRHGRQTPDPDPSARAGAPPSDWPPHRQVRAVIEGMSYQSRWMIRTHAAMGRPPQRVVLVAGERIPRLWSRTLTDVLPWPVALATAAEPVATGAALLAAVRSGLLGPARDLLDRAPVLAAAASAAPPADPHRVPFERFVDAARRGVLPASGDGSAPALP